MNNKNICKIIIKEKYVEKCLSKKLDLCKKSTYYIHKEVKLLIKRNFQYKNGYRLRKF